MYTVSLEIQNIDTDDAKEAARIFQAGMREAYPWLELTFAVKDDHSDEKTCVKLPPVADAAPTLRPDAIKAAALAMSEEDRKTLICVLESSVGWHSLLMLAESDVRESIAEADVTDGDIAEACEQTARKFDCGDLSVDIIEAAKEHAKEIASRR